MNSAVRLIEIIVLSFFTVLTVFGGAISLSLRSGLIRISVISDVSIGLLSSFSLESQSVGCLPCLPWMSLRIPFGASALIYRYLSLMVHCMSCKFFGVLLIFLSISCLNGRQGDSSQWCHLFVLPSECSLSLPG